MKSYDYLISYNIKPSVQRIAIMDYLLAQDVYKRQGLDGPLVYLLSTKGITG